MGRRRQRQDEIPHGLGPLIALLAVGAVILPGFRESLGSLVPGILVLGVVVLAVWIGMRLIRRRHTQDVLVGEASDAEQGLRVIDLASLAVTEVAKPAEAATPATGSDRIGMLPRLPALSHRSRPLTRGPTLLEQLRELDWFQFEKIVAVLYRKHGYLVERRGGANADGGIDLVLAKGADRWAVQCKHWMKWKVRTPVVREMLGALQDSGIPKGIVITMRGYTEEAQDLAARHGIQIVAERELVRRLEAVDARFDPEIIEALRDPRKLCPRCESDMVLRTATRGSGVGERFWGCSRYPECHYTMKARELSSAR